MEWSIKNEKIVGESLRKDGKAEIDIISWSAGHNLAWNHSDQNTLKPVDRAHFSDLSIVKKTDASSPSIYQACAQAEHLGELTLFGRNQNMGDQKPQQSVVLKDAVITSVNYSGQDGGYGTDCVTFGFTSITWQFHDINEKGGEDKVLTTGWDLNADTKAGK